MISVGSLQAPLGVPPLPRTEPEAPGGGFDQHPIIRAQPPNLKPRPRELTLPIGLRPINGAFSDIPVESTSESAARLDPRSAEPVPYTRRTGPRGLSRLRSPEPGDEPAPQR